MAIIKRIRSVQGAGIFADRSAKDEGPVFRRLNLIYGFNGSGKSTLSRIFACLEAGKRHAELPSSCTFEIELDDGAIYGAPDSLGGLEGRVCVFNTDFIERNLRWGEGRANSIFYISEEQADIASELDKKRHRLPQREDAKKAQDRLVTAREKAVKSFRTDRAKLVTTALHLANRRYEALQLLSDYQKLELDEKSILTEEVLGAYVDVARRAEPPPPLAMLKDPAEGLPGLAEAARRHADASIGQAALDEMEKHPTMVPWLKAGNDYHTAQKLEACLLCGNEFAEIRKAELAAALDEKLADLMTALRRGQGLIDAAREGLKPDDNWPKVAAIDPSLQAAYSRALDELKAALKLAEGVLDESRRIVDERLARPTVEVTHALPAKDAVTEIRGLVAQAIAAANELLVAHNALAEDFTKQQDAARAAIKKHYLAEGLAEYNSLQDEQAAAVAEAKGLEAEVEALKKEISELSEKVRTHGPAAGKITKLVQSYLGHGELTIFPADEGYELRRHGKIVKGPPSEGEKTAIALCYFISTLEADGRAVKDLIVVVDDPISSLDSKALNYACCLIRSALDTAAQVPQPRPTGLSGCNPSIDNVV
jgi:wobble nucleotide-excising tRNase